MQNSPIARGIRLVRKLSALFVCGGLVASAASAQTASIPGADLPRFLARQLGPVVDARVQGDCPEERRLARSAIRIALELGSDSENTQMMAEEFLARAAAEPRLVRARQRGATVLVVCCGGMRAQKAAELLAANGYKAVFMSDGLASAAVPDQALARVRK